MKQLISIAELCEELGVNTATIRRYQKMGMPVVKGKSKAAGNKYDPDACAAWMAANKKTGDVGRQPGELSDEMKREQLRKVKAQADKYEQELKTARMEYDVASGSLLKKEEVEQGRLLRIGYVKNGLLGFASSLAPQLEGLTAQEIQGKVEAEVLRLLEHFSKG